MFAYAFANNVASSLTPQGHAASGDIMEVDRDGIGEG